MKISVIIPNFNGQRFLEAAILSILEKGGDKCKVESETKDPEKHISDLRSLHLTPCTLHSNYELELIVVDGGSTDESVEIIKRYADRISYWVSEKDAGHYDAVNKGFAKATGDVLCWLNSDDMLAPGALGTVAEVFEQCPDVDWITGRPSFWDEEGSMIGECLTPGAPASRAREHREEGDADSRMCGTQVAVADGERDEEKVGDGCISLTEGTKDTKGRGGSLSQSTQRSAEGDGIATTDEHGCTQMRGDADSRMSGTQVAVADGEEGDIEQKVTKVTKGENRDLRHETLDLRLGEAGEVDPATQQPNNLATNNPENSTTFNLSPCTLQRHDAVRCRAYSRKCLARGEHDSRILHGVQQESCFWRRSLLEKVGGKVDTQYSLAGDFDLWTRFAEHAELVAVDAVLAGNRQHAKQRSRLQHKEYFEQVDKICSERGARRWLRSKWFYPLRKVRGGWRLYTALLVRNGKGLVLVKDEGILRASQVPVR